MYNIVQHRKWYYILSSIIIIPGLLVMLYSLATTGRPLKLSCLLYTSPSPRD